MKLCPCGEDLHVCCSINEVLYIIVGVLILDLESILVNELG